MQAKMEQERNGAFLNHVRILKVFLEQHTFNLPILRKYASGISYKTWSTPWFLLSDKGNTFKACELIRKKKQAAENPTHPERDKHGWLYQCC